MRVHEQRCNLDPGFCGLYGELKWGLELDFNRGRNEAAR